jgi:uncharacterized protein Yka (UPF0111/DUF47 family)
MEPRGVTPLPHPVKPPTNMNLLPRETCFFDFFETHAANTVEGCRSLVKLAKGEHDVHTLSAKIKEIESACDKVTHDTVSSLHRVFITPIERDDIHHLISKMDDVIDLIERTARIIDIYEVRVPSQRLVAMTSTLLASTLEMCEAVKGLRDLRGASTILSRCVEINRLENESDRQLEEAIGRLVRESTDPIDVIKWKEVFETIETATDSCEDVANIIEGVLMENR